MRSRRPIGAAGATTSSSAWEEAGGRADQPGIGHVRETALDRAVSRLTRLSDRRLGSCTAVRRSGVAIPSFAARGVGAAGGEGGPNLRSLRPLVHKQPSGLPLVSMQHRIHL